MTSADKRRRAEQVIYETPVTKQVDAMLAFAAELESATESRIRELEAFNIRLANESASLLGILDKLVCAWSRMENFDATDEEYHSALQQFERAISRARPYTQTSIPESAKRLREALSKLSEEFQP